MEQPALDAFSSGFVDLLIICNRTTEKKIETMIAMRKLLNDEMKKTNYEVT